MKYITEQLVELRKYQGHKQISKGKDSVDGSKHQNTTNVVTVFYSKFHFLIFDKLSLCFVIFIVFLVFFSFYFDIYRLGFGIWDVGLY